MSENRHGDICVVRLSECLIEDTSSSQGLIRHLYPRSLSSVYGQQMFPGNDRIRLGSPGELSIALISRGPRRRFVGAVKPVAILPRAWRRFGAS